MINLTEKYLKKYKLQKNKFYTKDELVNRHNLNYAMFYRIDRILNLFEKKTNEIGETIYRLSNTPFFTGIDKEFTNLVEIFKKSKKQELDVYKLHFRK